MKIEGPSSARPGQVKKATRSGGGAFARHIQGGDEDDSVSRSSGSQSLSGINPLFALQEVDDALSGKKRKAQARGEDILDRLDEIRLGLLLGAIPLEKLHELTRVLQSRIGDLDDPELQQVLDEIDLRAQVEIAKLTPHA